MNQTVIPVSKNKYTSYSIVILFVLICIAMGTALFAYYCNLDKMIRLISTSEGDIQNILRLRGIFLLCGAFILIVLALLGYQMLTGYRSRCRLESLVFVDPVTSGHTLAYFYEKVPKLLAYEHHPPYAMIYTNFRNFKLLNELFGEKTCNTILYTRYHATNNLLRADECMGRLFADHFCILVRYEGEAQLVERFAEWQRSSEEYVQKNGFLWMPTMIEFGVFALDDETMPLSQMVDRAKLALSTTTATLHGKLRYAFYDEQVRRTLLRDKQLEDRMEAALENGEFSIFLQPKFCIATNQIGGAEALARWTGAQEGIIYPDEFIPLFERNGFIAQLDLFVFTEVCQTLARWILQGKKPLPVSVNCSRIHLKMPHFLDEYSRIAEKYCIPESLLEIEVTENAVFENVEQLSEIIRRIRMAGFGCSMDDFGSGYSSLNQIQDIPVDTIKLDKVFFHMGRRDSARTEAVVGSVIALSKALQLKTVAEGVESLLQVEMLRRLGCNQIQGYFFAKPMPVADFEALVFPA